jgi:heterodisulfide reductase subunit B
MDFSYYPGCTLKTKAKDLDRYARRAAARLGIHLTDCRVAVCCGAVYPQASDEIAARLSAVRALAGAKALGQELVTLCAACHHVLKRVNLDMARDETIRSRANNYLRLDVPYGGETDVIHYLELLRDKIGFDAVRAKVVKPLAGRKIAAIRLPAPPPGRDANG